MTNSRTMIDNERTRVTLWTFKPGEETGQHIHEFDYVGAFRMFDNCDENYRVVINGESQQGPGRWKNRQYINKIRWYKAKN